MRETQGQYLGGASAGGVMPGKGYDVQSNENYKSASSGDIERELSSIDSIIESLSKQTCQLEERVRAVLRPEPPATATQGGPAPVSSVPMAACLGVIRSKLSYVSAHIDNITSRIDF